MSVQARVEWHKLIPGILLSLLAIGIILLVVNPLRVLDELLHANYFWVLLSALTSITWLMVRASFWRTLLLDSPAWQKVFYTVCEGYLLNNFLPFRMGEIGRAWLLSRKSELQFWQILPSIVIERALDLGMAVVIFLGSLTMVVNLGSAKTIALAMGLAIPAGLAFLYVIARRRQAVQAYLERLAARSPRLKRFVESQLSALLAGLAILADGALFLKAIAWLLLNWSISILQVYLLMHAFFPQATFAWTIFTLGSLALGNAAPSTPGALGVYEATIVAALSLLNANHDTALAYAVTSHLFNYLFSGAIGAYALRQENINLKALFTNLYRRSLGQD